MTPRIAALVVLAASVIARGARAAGDMPMHAGISSGYQGEHRVWQSIAQLGDRMVYRGWIAVAPGTAVSFRPPDRGGDFTWGELKSGRAPLTARRGRGTVWPADSVWVELPLQVFATGQISVPGVRLVMQSAGGAVHDGNLPTVHLGIEPVLAANDTSSSLRPPRGPLAAPWWERVPWRWVGWTLLAVAGVVVLLLFLRRRKPVATPVVATPVRRRDPVAEALAELAALQRLGLPERGRFDEHAFHLGRILRRYFEATLALPRPGDTTPELISNLRLAGLVPDDVTRLTSLLRRWDGIKFARLDSSVEEAKRCEESVRELILKRATPAGKAA